MAGPFSGINMASNALRSFQRALDTTGHNIANVNTHGYSRQRVEFQPNRPLGFYSNGYWQVGQGVGISGINRIRDSFLDASMISASSQYGESSAASTTLGRIDRVFGEPSDTGIASSIEQFFNAWSGLGSNPTDPSAKSAVRNSAMRMTERIRTTYDSLQSLQANTMKTLDSTVGEINRLGEEIANLNKEILRSSSAGGAANDLMDQRDRAVDQLSKLVNVQKEVFADGQYAIYTAGSTLVDSGGARTMPNALDAATGSFTDKGVTYTIRSGELAGHLKGLSEATQQMANLDDLAVTLRDEINALHVTGMTEDGMTGIEFFESSILPKGGAAQYFQLSADVLASADNIVTGLSGKQGDGGLATAIAQMRESSQTALGNKTFSEFFQQSITDLATQVAYFTQAMATEESVMQQIDSQRQAVSGVSIDDEMAALMQYQRSYQAAARALTVFDQVTEDLIGMLRR